MHSAGQKSKSAMSSHSRASSASKRSRASSGKGGPGSINTSGGDPDRDADDESADSDQALDTLVGWGMKQKIDALKMRRRADRITVILTAASRGDLAAMKQAIRVMNVFTFFAFCDMYVNL